MIEKKVAVLGIIVVALVIAVVAMPVLYYAPILDELSSHVAAQQDQLYSKETQISSLNSQIANLQSQINTIQSSGNTLQSQYVELLTDYTQLQHQLELLLPPNSGITIDSIFTKPYYLTPAGVYNVTVRNFGSSDVHVTSLKLYYGTVLESSAAEYVTIPAKSAVTIQQFLAGRQMSDPTGSSYSLKVETLEGFKATSDPL